MLLTYICILIINNGTKILIPSENHILSVYLGR
nr:MAG TPA: hypothetical protein [Bacteriophage sp.]